MGKGVELVKVIGFSSSRAVGGGQIHYWQPGQGLHQQLQYSGEQLECPTKILRGHFNITNSRPSQEESQEECLFVSTILPKIAAVPISPIPTQVEHI